MMVFFVRKLIDEVYKYRHLYNTHIPIPNAR
jgi:hypothetical protein